MGLVKVNSLRAFVLLVLLFSVSSGILQLGFIDFAISQPATGPGGTNTSAPNTTTGPGGTNTSAPNTTTGQEVLIHQHPILQQGQEVLIHHNLKMPQEAF